MHDLYHWRAIYEDGTTLDEYDADGTAHGFAEVDQENLAYFVLLPQKEGFAHHILKMRPGLRPIFFRRRTRVVNQDTGEETTGPVIHCLGWQDTVKGTNVATYTFYFEDGSTVVTDDHQAV